MTFFVTVKKSLSGRGRDLNKTYINVVTSARRDEQRTFEQIAATGSWSDPAFEDFLVEINETEYKAIQDGVTPLMHDGLAAHPRFQQRDTGTGIAKEFGSWADPEDDQSVWRSGVAIPDPRWIIRIYDNDPLTTGAHVASAQLDEAPGTTSFYMRLFTATDNPSATNAQNQKTTIGGLRMIFDFTTGITTFGVETDIPGRTTFQSSEAYRVIGPNGEQEFFAEVFGRNLSMRG